MRYLLYKEFRLVSHPTVWLFLALSAMMLIPNYPFYVVFFYTSLGIFFCCLNGRENNDIFFTAALPVKKTDIVTARFLFVVMIQLLQVLIAIPFALLRNSIPSLGSNLAGMDANPALFGLSFVMMGLFDLVFFTLYYKAPAQVGRHFAIASVVQFLYILVMEGCTFAVPFFRDKLDTMGSQYMAEKLTVLGIGIVVYIILVLLSLSRCKKSFEGLDI